MQFALTLAALAATASAATAGKYIPNKDDFGIAKVVNRCSYDVYLWSIYKQVGCTKDASTLLKKNGGQWQQRMKDGANGGISIKLSKWDQCGGKELSQLEYKIDNYPPTDERSAFNGNYLDMSFVDCQQGGDCPGWHDGFYMESAKTGNNVQAASENNEHCPILKSSNAVQAAKISYVLPDDRQTKFCGADTDLTLYLCGDEAPGASDNIPSAAPSSSKIAAPSQPKPTTFQVLPSKPVSAPSKPAEDVQVKAAAVTPAPQAPAPEAPKAVKTVVKYVTVDTYQKRHAHGRRHSHNA